MCGSPLNEGDQRRNLKISQVREGGWCILSRSGASGSRASTLWVSNFICRVNQNRTVRSKSS